MAGAVVLAVAAAVPASAAPGTPPAEFGTDWDDPRTAVAPVAKPDTASCERLIVDHEFRDFTPYESTYAPPAECDGDWSKVVLRLEGAVAGRQFDRLGHLEIGGVPVFKTSTPEPSVDGIQWTVEKDVTAYAPLLRAERPVWMLIENVVDDTYTGILDVQVYLTFYTTDNRNPAGSSGETVTAETVLPLANRHQQDGTTVGELTVPRNTERIIADVYATGSGGGCEEFWYFTAPDDTYSCPNPDGPYREVQVLVDGQLAGIAAPFPHVYTGGWSNPFLWYVLPAPRAFDIRPITYDLTPFLGRLNDGSAHEITIRVVGVQEGAPGWAAPTAFRTWQDERSSVVTGELLSAEAGELENSSVLTVDGDRRQVDTTGSHRFSAVGRLRTSHGTVVTAVARRVSNESLHYWYPGEEPDGLTATWTDDSTVTTAGGGVSSVVRSEKEYTVDGEISVDDANRLTTVLRIADEAEDTVVTGRRLTRTVLSDVYDGEASWTLGVPRPDRHAVGTSEHHYVLKGTEGRYDHRIATVNGYVTVDEVKD